jgi:hypothetical protein
MKVGKERRKKGMKKSEGNRDEKKGNKGKGRDLRREVNRFSVCGDEKGVEK